MYEYFLAIGGAKSILTPAQVLSALVPMRQFISFYLSLPLRPGLSRCVNTMRDGVRTRTFLLRNRVNDCVRCRRSRIITLSTSYFPFLPSFLTTISQCRRQMALSRLSSLILPLLPLLLLLLLLLLLNSRPLKLRLLRSRRPIRRRTMRLLARSPLALVNIP